MGSRAGRVLLLAATMAVTFAAVSLGLLTAMPEPHRKVDFLVVGTVATFVSLIVLFLILIKTWVRTPDLFVKRRRKKE